MIWKGSRDIHEDPRSPRREKSAQGLRVVRTFNGPFTSLVASEPTVGQEMEGYEGVPVLTVQTEPLDAGPSGPGRMVIVAGNDEAGGGGGVIGSEDIAPTYEVEWTQLEKPLEQHPRYVSGGANALTDADLVDLDLWKQETTRALRIAFKYTSADGTEVTLSSNAQHLAAKVLRGQTSYFVPAPVARETTRSYTKPSTSTMGKRVSPPLGIGAPSGYEYVNSADRAIRQGRSGTWERVREWLGAEEWDHDIYPAG
ncbi:hypothetical protein ASA1KI_21300 [Opitutales bacterium ASA1]|uniref:hypothetical protein n=1 Tax=Congregicoccus parvus TaxID=3081749 RepID=UPI002B2FAAA2|nr:hypothetical protein ASA1KI_21300 [Opitutales bacterium ASA1]